MIKPAALDEELFIVLTLNQNQLAPALRVQETIAEYYNLYPEQNYPELHITLDRINKQSIPQATKFIQQIAQQQTELVEIIVKDFKCFQLENNFLVLEVKKTPSLLNLAHRLHTKLATAGISTIENYQEWKFHITIINNTFTENPLPDNTFNQLCINLKELKKELSTVGEALEIWRPTLDPDRKCVSSFNLNN